MELGLTHNHDIDDREHLVPSVDEEGKFLTDEEIEHLWEFVQSEVKSDSEEVIRRRCFAEIRRLRAGESPLRKYRYLQD